VPRKAKLKQAHHRPSLPEDQSTSQAIPDINSTTSEPALELEAPPTSQAPTSNPSTEKHQTFHEPSNNKHKSTSTHNVHLHTIPLPELPLHQDHHRCSRIMLSRHPHRREMFRARARDLTKAPRDLLPVQTSAVRERESEGGGGGRVEGYEVQSREEGQSCRWSCWSCSRKRDLGGGCGAGETSLKKQRGRQREKVRKEVSEWQRSRRGQRTNPSKQVQDDDTTCAMSGPPGHSAVAYRD
jgi:hypothetical protein